MTGLHSPESVTVQDHPIDTSGATEEDLHSSAGNGRFRQRLSRTRPAGYLLVGWCVVWAGWIPAAAMWIPYCTYSETWCIRTPVLSGRRTIASFIVIAVIGALALAALWWWDRHRAPISEPIDKPAQQRRARPTLVVVGSVIGVVAAAHLMLFAPPATQPSQCTAEIHLNSAMAYCLNVDSPMFLDLAHHPRQLLQPGAVRQSRPGYVAVSVVATRTIGRAASRLNLDRLYGQTDSAYIPLVLFNFVTVAVAVMLLAFLLARLGTPVPATVAICAFLAVNDVTKAFFWTPHQDVFTVFVPLASVFIAQWVIRTDPPWWKLALAGLSLGVYSLIYASVLITIAVVGIVLLARGWRGLARTAVLGAAFAIVPVAWIIACRAIVGSYYSHEVTNYHQFVWLFVEARHGPRALASYVEVVSIASMRGLVSVAGLILLLIVGLAAVAVRLRIGILPKSAEHRAILIASALTVGVSLVFGWGIGFISNRLMFNVVPALLVVLGWLAARLSARSPRMRTATGTALSGVALIVVGVTVTAAGPWS